MPCNYIESLRVYNDQFNPVVLNGGITLLRGCDGVKLNGGEVDLGYRRMSKC